VRRSSRKDSIIAAAQEVFARKGKDGATIDEIARLAGCSPAAICKHFQNKEQLHTHSLHQYFDETLRIIQDELPFEVSTEQHLQWMVVRLARLYAERGALARSAILHQIMQPEALDQRRRIFECLTQVFAKGIEKGELRDRDPRLYTMALGGMMNAWVQYWDSTEGQVPGTLPIAREELDAEQWSAVVVELFIHGAKANAP